MPKVGKNLVLIRLSQARESLEEAKTLLVRDAEVNFVMNSLYYAFLYPVLGLLQARDISAPMQSTAIALFEREFVETGDVDGRFLDALRKAFELRPACACEGQKKATHQDVEQLLPIADEFLENVRRIVE
ncbi:MAG: HEPN domain-containing protein [Betaproteobacteria bacterium]